jgi:hypothetical protein
MTIMITVGKQKNKKKLQETLPLPDFEKKRRAKERAKDTDDRQRDNKRNYKRAMATKKDSLEDMNQEAMRLASGIMQEDDSRSDPLITISKEQMENLMSLFDEEGSYLGDSGEGMIRIRLSSLAHLLASPDLEELSAGIDEEKGKNKKPGCSKGNPWRTTDGTFGTPKNATSWSLQNIKGGSDCRSGVRKANPARATKIPCGRKGPNRCKDGTNKNKEPAKR